MSLKVGGHKRVHLPARSWSILPSGTDKEDNFVSRDWLIPVRVKCEMLNFGNVK